MLNNKQDAIETKQLKYIIPDWPAPKNVKAFSTTRSNGKSRGRYRSFNLGLHVGDDAENVSKNRFDLTSELLMPQAPMWLDQVHGNCCVPWSDDMASVTADASYSNQKAQPCLVMTADCLPILFCSTKRNWVAACHAGWRGLAAGVIENCVEKYSQLENASTADLIAWIGPALSQDNFEVGDDVRRVITKQSESYEEFFEQNENQKYQFDFIGLAKQKLLSMGIQTSGGNLCSFGDEERFFSYRRDGETGRMASLIWYE